MISRMILLRTSALSLPALLLLQACGSVGPSRPSSTNIGVGKTSGGFSAKALPPLKFCRKSKYPKLIEDRYDKDLRFFKSSAGVIYRIPRANQYADCDVVVKTEVLRQTAGHITGTVSSMYSNREFPLTYFNFLTVSPWKGMFKKAVDMYKPGSAEYRRVITERKHYRERSRVAAAERKAAAKRKKEQAARLEKERLAEEARKRALAQPAAAMSKEELQALVSAAVRGTLEAREKEFGKTAPSPRKLISDVDKPKYNLPKRPSDFALVIGIDGYSELPRARYAERDASAMSRHLEALGYPRRNIVTLLGSKAGKASLVKNLETWLPLNVKKESTVFVYFSGHGSPDPKTGQAYLVPWDGDPRYLKDTAYPVARLYKKLGALKAKKVIVALDSCFSGTGGRSVLPDGTRPLVNRVRMGKLSGGKLVVLSASRSDEISGVIEEQAHGTFTYYLLRGLNGAAKNDAGRVTVRSLYDYIVPNVEDSARRQNRSQTPQITPASGSAVQVLR